MGNRTALAIGFAAGVLSSVALIVFVASSPLVAQWAMP